MARHNVGGPDMAPHTPHAPRPGKPGGAPRVCSQVWGFDMVVRYFG